MKFKYNNGGSKFKERRDCVIRSIAIATNQDYMKILNDFKSLMKEPPYKGVPKKIYKKYLKDIKWRWDFPHTSDMRQPRIYKRQQYLPIKLIYYHPGIVIRKDYQS
jgi:hypothetical protein